MITGTLTADQRSAGRGRGRPIIHSLRPFESTRTPRDSCYAAARLAGPASKLEFRFTLPNVYRTLRVSGFAGANASPRPAGRPGHGMGRHGRCAARSGNVRGAPSRHAVRTAIPVLPHRGGGPCQQRKHRWPASAPRSSNLSGSTASCRFSCRPSFRAWPTSLSGALHRAFGALDERADVVGGSAGVLRLPVPQAIEGPHSRTRVLNHQQQPCGTKPRDPVARDAGLLVQEFHGRVDLKVNLWLALGHRRPHQGIRYFLGSAILRAPAKQCKALPRREFSAAAPRTRCAPTVRKSRSDRRPGGAELPPDVRFV